MTYVTIPRAGLSQFVENNHANHHFEATIDGLASHIYEISFNTIGVDLLHGFPEQYADDDRIKLIHGSAMGIAEFAKELKKLQPGVDLEVNKATVEVFQQSVGELKKLLPNGGDMLQAFSRDRLDSYWGDIEVDNRELRITLAENFSRNPTDKYALLNELSKMLENCIAVSSPSHDKGRRHF